MPTRSRLSPGQLAPRYVDYRALEGRQPPDDDWAAGVRDIPGAAHLDSRSATRAGGGRDKVGHHCSPRARALAAPAFHESTASRICAAMSPRFSRARRAAICMSTAEPPASGRDGSARIRSSSARYAAQSKHAQSCSVRSVARSISPPPSRIAASPCRAASTPEPRRSAPRRRWGHRRPPRRRARGGRSESRS